MLQRLHRFSHPFDTPQRLNTIFRVGCYLLAFELVAFIVFSYVQAEHFNLEQDFAQFGQAWYKIAHFDFTAQVTFKNRPFYADHGDFFFYLFAPLWYIWPHVVTLMWAQDLFACIAQLVALRWIYEHLSERKSVGYQSSEALMSLGLVLLIFNPWILWSIANDFHTEIFGVCFLVLAARAFFRRRPIAWLWAVLVISNGNVAASYLVGLALGLVVVRRGLWRQSIGLLFAVALSLFLATAFGADRGSSFRGYQYLAGPGGVAPNSAAEVLKLIVSNPGRALSNLFSNRLSLWATLSVPGFVGLFSPWVFGIILVCVVENGVISWPYFTPAYGFQNFAVHIFLPIGTVFVLSRFELLGDRLRTRSLRLLVATQLIWTLGWFVVWTPEAPRRWISIPSNSASVLREVASQIDRQDQVVASQGVIGAFSPRNELYMLAIAQSDEISIPIRSKRIWFVITPNLGIETQPSTSAFKLLSRLVSLPGIQLLRQKEGVFALLWQVPHGYGDTLQLHFSHNDLLPYLFDSTNWDENGFSGSAGYVLSGFYQIVDRPQNFSYSVTLKSDGPLTLEVWNSTTSELLVRRNIVSTGNAPLTFDLNGNITRIHGTHVWNGIWPFTSQVEPPIFDGDALELRIFSPGDVVCHVINLISKTEFEAH